MKLLPVRMNADKYRRRMAILSLFLGVVLAPFPACAQDGRPADSNLQRLVGLAVQKESTRMKKLLEDAVETTLNSYDLSLRFDTAVKELQKDENFSAFLKKKASEQARGGTDKQTSAGEIQEYWRTTNKLPEEVIAWFGLAASGLNVPWQNSAPDYRILAEKRSGDFQPPFLMLFRRPANGAEWKEWLTALKRAAACATNSVQRTVCLDLVAYRVPNIADSGSIPLKEISQWANQMKKAETSPSVLKEMGLLQLLIAIGQGNFTVAAGYTKDTSFRAWRPIFFILGQQPDRAREAIAELKAVPGLSEDEEEAIKAAEQALSAVSNAKPATSAK